jgi:hypothetical protein
MTTTETTIKHTPSPWEDNGNGLIYGQCSGDDDEAPFVADVCSDPNRYTEQEQANARLIHSAPALLAACRMIVTRWARGDLAEAARACQAAVELATGDGPPWDITDAMPARWLQQAASTLLAALEEVIDYAENEAYSLEKLKDSPEAETEAERAWKAVETGRDAIAQAKGAGSASSPPDIDIHALLARHQQIASVWSTEDVQAIRPDLTNAQSWEVLQAAGRYHDATIGINWDVLSCHADMLFGDAPETDEAEEA